MLGDTMQYSKSYIFDRHAVFAAWLTVQRRKPSSMIPRSGHRFLEEITLQTTNGA
jgi:hypothetical protein